jgi:hypothetical protein
VLFSNALAFAFTLCISMKFKVNIIQALNQLLIWIDFDLELTKFKFEDDDTNEAF